MALDPGLHVDVVILQELIVWRNTNQRSALDGGVMTNQTGIFEGKQLNHEGAPIWARRLATSRFASSSHHFLPGPGKRAAVQSGV